ncbi:MAG: hypothetical protein P4N59_26045 [Negativicutes bacterium]|nr:hypothetical protein [Negativicutes bacterium]
MNVIAKNAFLSVVVLIGAGLALLSSKSGVDFAEVPWLPLGAFVFVGLLFGILFGILQRRKLAPKPGPSKKNKRR